MKDPTLKSGDQAKRKIFLLAVVTVIAIGIVDYLTGDEFSLSLFYMFPIVYATMKTGRFGGASISVLSAAAELGADLGTGLNFSHPLFYAWDAFVRVGVYLVISLTAAQWLAALNREKELARKDFLTGINNTRAFYEEAEKEIERSQRYGHPVSVAYIDCDDFKSINDRFGHHGGDALLTLIAKTLQGSIRATDSAARLGGDEFAVLLPETNLESAAEMVDRIRLQLAQAMRDNSWPITFSIGVSSFLVAPRDVDEMIRTADRLMYAVKASGKNNFRHEIFHRTGTGIDNSHRQE